MTDVHARIHQVKEEESKNYQYVGSDKANPFDPTMPVADMITSETWLLCFDEFQVRSHFFLNHKSLLQIQFFDLVMPFNFNILT